MGNLFSSTTSSTVSESGKNEDQSASDANKVLQPSSTPIRESINTGHSRPSTFPFPPLQPSIPADLTSMVTMDESAWRNRKMTTHFCVVEGTYKPAWNSQSIKVALKVFRLQEERPGKELPQEFQNEVLKLTELRHRNLLPYFGMVRIDCSGPAFVIPWMEQNVMQYLTVNPQADKLLLIREMSEGLAYLHGLSPPIAHGNLTGANIWVDARGHVRLADYGLHRWWSTTQEVTLKAHNAFETPWSAPETIKPKWFEGAPEGYRADPVVADMWSWGMTVYQLITLREPSWEHSRAFSYIEYLSPEQWPAGDAWTEDEDDKTRRLRELAQRCWVQPKDRPTIRAVLAELRAIPDAGAVEGELEFCGDEMWGGAALVPLPAQIFSERLYRYPTLDRVRSSLAEVWQARYMQDDEPDSIVALKHFWPYMRILQSGRYADVENFLREAERWPTLKHPNVVPFLGTALIPRTGPCFVYGWTGSGNIMEYLVKNPAASKRRLAVGIAKGLEYLHTRSPPVLHGDLQPCQILMSQNGEPRISDYGLFELKDLFTRTESTSYMPTWLRYQAPEQLNPERFGLPEKEAASPAADMFSFGMLLYEICSGEKPYYPMRNLYTAMMNIIDGVWPEIPPDWDRDEETSALSGVIQRCWWLDRDQRPSAGDVIGILSSVRSI